MFFENVCLLRFFRPPELRSLLRGLILSYCLVSRFNGMVIIILNTLVPSFLLINFNLKNFWKFFIVFQVYGSLSQWNCLRLEICILGSFLRQWNGVLKILILRILARFCLSLQLFLKLLNILCFSEFNNPYWPTKLFKSWVTWQILSDKKCFWTFSLLRNVETFLLKFALSVFFYDLVTNKSRKLEILRPNLIMEKIPLSESFSVLAVISLLLFLAHV